MPAGPLVGVDVGGTKCLGLLIDPDGGVVAERRVPTPPTGEALVTAIGDLVEELLIGSEEVPRIGVGVPGLVDRHGTLRYAPNLPGIRELPVAQLLSARLGSPVAVDNDATGAALAEWRLGAGRGVDDLVLVTLGTGIGGGVVCAGRLVRGEHGFGGEFGHMVVDPAGPPCPCGGRGCWERFASGSGLGWLGRRAARDGRAPGLVAMVGGEVEQLRGEHVSRAARRGDAGALVVADEWCRWLALGLTNLANLLDPGRIVVGGGLVVDADLYLARVRRHFHDLVLARAHRPEPPIVPAALGERAGALGAALGALLPAEAARTVDGWAGAGGETPAP